MVVYLKVLRKPSPIVKLCVVTMVGKGERRLSASIPAWLKSKQVTVNHPRVVELKLVDIRRNQGRVVQDGGVRRVVLVVMTERELCMM